MTTGQLWSDPGVSTTISALILVRDPVGTVGPSASVRLIVTHSNSSLGSSSAPCTASGFCTAVFTVPTNWFQANANVSLSYAVTGGVALPLLSGSNALVLNPPPTYTVTNNVVLVIPNRNLLPGTAFSIPVYGNATRKISLFTLSFTVDVGVTITGIVYSTSDWQAVVKKNSATVSQSIAFICLNRIRHLHVSIVAMGDRRCASCARRHSNLAHPLYLERSN